MHDNKIGKVNSHSPEHKELSKAFGSDPDANETAVMASACGGSGCSPPKPMVEYALEYAARGIPVFPILPANPDGTCTCSKGKDCKAAGKHPACAHGHLDATTDPAKLAFLT